MDWASEGEISAGDEGWREVQETDRRWRILRSCRWTESVVKAAPVQNGVPMNMKLGVLNGGKQ